MSKHLIPDQPNMLAIQIDSLNQRVGQAVSLPYNPFVSFSTVAPCEHSFEYVVLTLHATRNLHAFDEIALEHEENNEDGDHYDQAGSH